MRSDSERLTDILTRFSASAATSNPATGTASTKTEVLQNAVLRWLEIIGEASRGLTDQFCHVHQEVTWREIFGMRNRVTHGYFDIDLDVVWNTVMTDLPALEDAVVRWLPSDAT